MVWYGMVLYCIGIIIQTIIDIKTTLCHTCIADVSRSTVDVTRGGTVNVGWIGFGLTISCFGSGSFFSLARIIDANFCIHSHYYRVETIFYDFIFPAKLKQKIIRLQAKIRG